MNVQTRTAFKSHIRHDRVSKLSAVASRYSSRPPRKLCTACRAELGTMLDTAVTWGALSISLGATVYAVFHSWPRSKAAEQQQPGALASSDDNFTWAVMGVVSCFPLFNSMAWVLGALQSDTPRPFYWAAALYALPLLRNGFDQDWFSISLLLLGAAHIQVLRIAATEPELQAQLQQQLKPLAVVNTAASAAGAAVAAVLGTNTDSSSSSSRQLGPGSSQGINDVLGQGDASGLDAEEVLRQQELQEFDRRLEQRSAQGRDKP